MNPEKFLYYIMFSQLNYHGLASTFKGTVCVISSNLASICRVACLIHNSNL